MNAKKKLLAALAAVLAIVALMAACSAAAPDGFSKDEAAPTMAAAASAAPAPPADSTAAPQANASAGSGSNVPVIDPGDAKAAGKKIIYTGSMSIEAKDAAAAIQDISTAAAELGGFVSDMQFDGNSRSGWITVRIPPEQLQDFIKHVGALGKQLDQKLSSKDVTDQYFDAQARLTNAESQETELLGVMKQATTIDDILKVRKELDSVQQEIEQLKGQLSQMDSQVGFSTLRISVQEPPLPTPSPTPEPTPSPTPTAKPVQFMGFSSVGQKIGRGVSDSFNWTLNAISWILTILSYIIIPLLIIAAVVVAIVLIVKLASKKKKKV